MSALSDYLESAILNHIFHDTAYTKPTVIYVALFTDAPGEGTPANECAYTGYARVDAALGAAINTGWTAVADAPTGTGKQVTNAKVLTFGANTDVAAVTVTHIALFDAATAGNMLYLGALEAAKTIQTNDVLSFAIGTIKASLD